MRIMKLYTKLPRCGVSLPLLCWVVVSFWGAPVMCEQQKYPPVAALTDMQQGDSAFAAANFSAAYELYSRALSTCYKLDPPPVFTTRMCGTAMHEATVEYYRKHKNFIVLELMDKSRRAELAKNLGAYNPHQIYILDQLASLYEEQNLIGKAEAMLKEALELAKAQKDQPSLVPDRTQALIKFYEKHQDKTKAAKLYEELLITKTKNNADESSREKLARMYQDSGRFKEAEPHWLHLLALGEERYLKADCIYPGPNSFKEAFAALVEGYLKQGQLAKAEQLCKKELAYKEGLQRASKYHHEWYGNEALEPMLSMLAKCYEAQNQYAKAEELYQRLLMIYEHSDGEKVIAIKQSYANILQRLHRNEEANAMRQFVEQCKQDEARPEPRRSDQAVAEWRRLADQGRELTRKSSYKEAETILQSALKQANSFDPPGDYGARTLYYLGENCYYQNKMDEAEQYYEKALKLAEKIYGTNHTGLSLYLSGLSGLYWWQRKFAEAEPFYRRELALEGKEQWPGAPTLATPTINLGQCLYMLGRKADAMALFNKAIAYKQHWCPNREQARTLKTIGKFLKSQNDPEADAFLSKSNGLQDLPDRKPMS